MELASYPCLSIREAVHYYDASPKQIKRDIKSGKIPAVKLETQKGKRWRIFPTGIPQDIQDAVNEKSSAKLKIAELTEQVKQLESVIEQLQKQLEQKNALVLVQTVSNQAESNQIIIEAEPVPLKDRLAFLFQRLLNPLKRKEMQPQG